MGFGSILAEPVVFNFDVRAIWDLALRPDLQIASVTEQHRYWSKGGDSWLK